MSLTCPTASDPAFARMVPQDIAAEACVLGSMALDMRCIPSVRQIVTAEDFQRPSHETVFAALVAMAGRGEQIDLVTLKAHLDATGQLETIGGVEYLVELVEGVPSATNVEYYARIVRDKSVARGIIRAGVSMVDLAYSEESPGEVAEEGMRALHQQASRLHGGAVCESDAGPAAAQAVGLIEQRIASPGIDGVQTGLYELDAVTHGWRKGHLIVLGADTGCGKTTVALCQAAHAAGMGSRGLYVSAEMPGVELSQRLLSSAAGVNGKRILSGDMTPEQFQAIQAAAGGIASMPLRFVPRACSLADIRMAITERRIAWGRVDFVVIDYLQIMRLPERHSRREAVAEYITGLKDIAMEYEIPIVVLSQLNRNETTRDEPPELHSFIESSSIEQAANSAILLWRDRKNESWEATPYDAPRHQCQRLYVKVAKQRDGAPTNWATRGDGIVLRWYPWLTEVTDWN